MLISISDFDHVLRNDQSRLLQLRGAQVVTEGIAARLSHRTTRFWEVCIKWQGEHYLLMLPLDKEVVADLERVVYGLKLSGLEIAAPHAILSREYTAHNPMGECRAFDLVLEKLPSLEGATLLSDRLCGDHAIDREAIFAAVEELEAAFLDASVCHNNLKVSNLILTKDGALLPIRYINATFDTKPQESIAEFNMLRREIAHHLDGASKKLEQLRCSQQNIRSHIADEPQWESDSSPRKSITNPHPSNPQWSDQSSARGASGASAAGSVKNIAPQRLEHKHIAVVRNSTMKISGEFEGLRRVFDHGRYGYIDDRGRVAIDLQFITAENFREDRAEVTAQSGLMGLINGRGEWVIPPHFAIVEFDVDNACVMVKEKQTKTSKWALYSYEGEPITLFEFNYIRNEQLPEILRSLADKSDK